MNAWTRWLVASPHRSLGGMIKLIMNMKGFATPQISELLVLLNTCNRACFVTHPHRVAGAQASSRTRRIAQRHLLAGADHDHRSCSARTRPPPSPRTCALSQPRRMMVASTTATAQALEPDLPSSFIESALPTRREYEASLSMPLSERRKAEAAARDRQQAHAKYGAPSQTSESPVSVMAEINPAAMPQAMPGCRSAWSQQRRSSRTRTASAAHPKPSPLAVVNPHDDCDATGRRRSERKSDSRRSFVIPGTSTSLRAESVSCHALLTASDEGTLSARERWRLFRRSISPRTERLTEIVRELKNGCTRLTNVPLVHLPFGS